MKIRGGGGRGRAAPPLGSASVIVWGSNSITTQDFESTSDMAANGDTDLVGSANGYDSLNPTGYRNPYHKVVGIPGTDNVLSWWEELRSNKLRHEEFKEELLSNQAPVEQEKYFKAPELPSQIKSSFKESQDVTQDKLKDSHDHLLKTALALIHVFDAIVDPKCPETIDSSLVLQHITSVLILLGSASQSLAFSRQHAFDDLLDRFDSLKQNSPSMDSLSGGNLAKDIEDAEKANKLAAKVTKATASSATSYRGNKCSPYYSAVTRKFRGDCSFKGRSTHNKPKYGTFKSSTSSRRRFRSDRGSIPSQNGRNGRNSVADKSSSIFCSQLEVPHTGQLDASIGGWSSNRVYNNSVSVTAQGAGNTHKLPISSRDCSKRGSKVIEQRGSHVGESSGQPVYFISVFNPQKVGRILTSYKSAFAEKNCKISTLVKDLLTP